MPFIRYVIFNKATMEPVSTGGCPDTDLDSIIAPDDPILGIAAIPAGQETIVSVEDHIITVTPAGDVVVEPPPVVVPPPPPPPQPFVDPLGALTVVVDALAVRVAALEAAAKP